MQYKRKRDRRCERSQAKPLAAAGKSGMKEQEQREAGKPGHVLFFPLALKKLQTGKEDGGLELKI